MNSNSNPNSALNQSCQLAFAASNVSTALPTTAPVPVQLHVASTVYPPVPPPPPVPPLESAGRNIVKYTWSMLKIAILEMVMMNPTPPSAKWGNEDSSYAELLKKLAFVDCWKPQLHKFDKKEANLRRKMEKTIESISNGTYPAPTGEGGDDFQQITDHCKKLWKQKLDVKAIREDQTEKATWEKECDIIDGYWGMARALGKVTDDRFYLAHHYGKKARSSPNYDSTKKPVFPYQFAWNTETNEPAYPLLDEKLPPDANHITKKRRRSSSESASSIDTSFSLDEKIAKILDSEINLSHTTFCSSFCNGAHNNCDCRFTRNDLKEENVGLTGTCPACHHPRSQHP